MRSRPGLPIQPSPQRSGSRGREDRAGERRRRRGESDRVKRRLQVEEGGPAGQGAGRACAQWPMADGRER